jgi:hypothetical protein
MVGRLLGVLGAVLILALSGCYLPSDFKAEIRINAIGDYSMMYVGDLVYAPLYQDAVQGKLTPAEIKEKTEVLIKDLQRDKVYDPVTKTTTDVPHFREVVSKGMGRFHVRFEREGWLDDRDQVSFVRRNALIIQLRTKDGKISIAVPGLNPTDSQRLMSLGLEVKGELRVVTNAQVLTHNATDIKTLAGYRVYIWKIENALSPSPRIVMKQEPRFLDRGTGK